MKTNTTANPFEAGTDDLERFALEECVKRTRFDSRVSVLVTPGGRCELAIKLAKLGAHVTVADLPGNQQEVEGRVLAAGHRDDIDFLPLNLSELAKSTPGQAYDLIFIRRGLCLYPYAEACEIVHDLMRHLKIGGKLYLSILGLHSELGEGYPPAEKPIEERFARLAPAVAKNYGIDAPVCLYTERNLFLLMLEAGASVLRTMTSTYGIVKGIAVRV